MMIQIALLLALFVEEHVQSHCFIHGEYLQGTFTNPAITYMENTYTANTHTGIPYKKTIYDHAGIHLWQRVGLVRELLGFRICDPRQIIRFVV